MTDWVGVVVVGDADAPQFDTRGYVPDAAFSDSDCFPSFSTIIAITFVPNVTFLVWRIREGFQIPVALLGAP